MLIRPATAEDAAAIQAMIRQEHLNPMGLDWRRFLVAEIEGQVAGIGQVKPHSDGSRELASLAVLPQHQGAGIGSQLVEALLARESGPIYLFCTNHLEDYYTRFGFQKIPRTQLPPVMARIHRLGNWMATIASKLSQDKFSLIAMRRYT